MPLPTFVPPAAARLADKATLSRTQAAAMLGIAPGTFDKLVRAHLIALPVRASAVAELAARPPLRVQSGALTVLRTDAINASDPHRYPGDDRPYIGFGTAMTDEEVAAASLRWWRSDPEIVVDNQLFAVALATIPVAVFEVTETLDCITRPDEASRGIRRYSYGGRLLARIHEGGLEPVVERALPKDLRDRAAQIMASRILNSDAAAGGPIAYLNPVPEA
ncbi:hypothetical protein [Cellulomonas sp. ICMP 17802]|uniref:hypothetical protein n=1 Tax=Cellulomonas sp. ICMP 17802 TaxID=3239199 RepID=UPI00351B942C